MNPNIFNAYISYFLWNAPTRENVQMRDAQCVCCYAQWSNPKLYIARAFLFIQKACLPAIATIRIILLFALLWFLLECFHTCLVVLSFLLFQRRLYEKRKEMTFNYGAGTRRADLITSQRLTSTKFITHLAFNFSPPKVTSRLFKSGSQYSAIIPG